MTKQEFAQFAMALRTYYSKENLLPNNQAMELWYMQLQDIPYEIAEASLNKWVTTNKWSPSIADIREMAVTVKDGEKPLWSDGWEEVLMAIRKYGSYQESLALESMSEITRKAVQRLGFRNLCMSEEIMADRANFRMVFDQIAEREQTAKQIPAKLSNLIESIQSTNKIERRENDRGNLQGTGASCEKDKRLLQETKKKDYE